MLLHRLEQNSSTQHCLESVKNLLACVQSSYGDVASNDVRKRRSNSLDSSGSQVLCDSVISTCIGLVDLVISALTKPSTNQVQVIESHFPALARQKLTELSESFIKLISDDNSRLNAYLAVGKLKLAYLLAVSTKRSENIEAVLNHARLSNDTTYVKICEMWLRKNML